MSFYLVSPSAEPTALGDLEDRLRQAIPELRHVTSIEEVLAAERDGGVDPDRAYVLLPIAPHERPLLEDLKKVSLGQDGQLFFILISDEISASDYKSLVRLGNADWVASRNAPQEILDIVASHAGGARRSGQPGASKPAIATFIPSAGGVGNTTLAIESAIQLKANKASRHRSICLIDLDFQTSHVCDLLDIDPRLQIGELAQHPERLDTQLFDSFISRHDSGLDVLATPRSKHALSGLEFAALDALFGFISERYNLLVIDMPVYWSSWTDQILGVSDLAVVTGLLTIPGLRQVAEAVAAVRAVERIPPQIAVALNRCQSRFLRGITGEHYVHRMLKGETVHYIHEDTVAAQHSVNTGVPIATATPSSKIAKDSASLAKLLAELKPAVEPAKQSPTE